MESRQSFEQPEPTAPRILHHSKMESRQSFGKIKICRKAFYITRKWNQGKAYYTIDGPELNFTSLENGIKAKLKYGADVHANNFTSLENGIKAKQPLKIKILQWILHHSKMESRQSSVPDHPICRWILHHSKMESRQSMQDRNN